MANAKLWVIVAVRVAKISFKTKIAGDLEETAGGSRFVYREGWRETIACCLPVARREHEWRQGLHPFFQHLGAEGWLRERQARRAHVAGEDDFGLLLRYGADCIGAVGVLPLTGEDEFVLTEANELASPGRTVSGVQRKLLVYKDVTAFQLGHVAELGESALIVTRFDRTEQGEKLRAEDFAQILSKPRGADYAGKYDASYEEVADVIRTYSARPAIDLARLFRRLVAFAMVANGDAHLKNFSLLERPEGLRLSPVYDVVNVGLYAAEGVSQQFALAIGSDFINLEAVTRPVLEAFGKRIGLGKTVVDRSFRDLASRLRHSAKLLPQAGDEGRDPFGARYTEIVRNQCAKLLEA